MKFGHLFSFARRAVPLGLALWSAAAAPSESGLPLVQPYPVSEYEGHNQTWAMIQDRAGVLHVGNRDAVLTYDGKRWGRIPTGGLFIYALAVDAEDRIWFGGVNELGYLAPDGRGGRTLVSLRGQVPAEAQAFGSIFQVFALHSGVYFVASGGTLRWHDGKFTFDPGERQWGNVVGEELVIHQRGQPLRAFDGRDWRTVLEAEVTRNNWVIFVAARPEGGWLLGTLTDGFWLLRDGQARRWETEVDPRLRENRISRATLLRDGGIALSQRPGGVLVLDSAGRLRHYLDADQGLPASLSSQFFQDRQDHLWISLDRGLARLSWPPQVTLFSRANGLGPGVVKALARHAGRLYVGTSVGLFVLEDARPGELPPRNARLVPVPAPLTQNIWSLHAADDRLAVGANSTAALLHADGSREIVADGLPVSCVRWLGRGGHRLLIGTTDGAMVAQRVGPRWGKPQPIPDVKGEVRSAVELADGTLWLAVATQGFYRVRGLAENAGLSVEHFPGGHGLPSAKLEGIPTLIDQPGEALFLDDGKVHRFDAPTRRFQPVESLDLGLAGVSVNTLAPGHAGRLWFRTVRTDPLAGPWQGRQFWSRSPDGQRATLPYDVAAAIGENPTLLEEPGADGRTVLWLGGSEGLVRAELPGAFVTPRPYQAFFRQIRDGTGAALALSGPPPALPYSQRDLTLTFAADRLDGRHLRYQTKLDDEPWSAPGVSAELTLPRLAPGRHTVSARARDADGRESTPVSYSFSVLPPWWLTWWALGLYVAGGATGLAALLQWRVRASARRNAELELIVATRTAELRERERELVVARDSAEAANRAKSVFLASMSHELRTPLNAILGYAQILRQSPGFGAEQRRQLETVHASGDHLLHLINDVLDLAKIEAGKVELHPQPMSLARLLAHLTEVFEPRAAQKKIAFSLHGETALPDTILGDEARLRQVLYNLLGNALKFTERGRIELRVGMLGDALRFSVIDTGIGIAPAEQAAIFGLFHQAAGPALSAQGSGLGLAISQRLVRLMGGEITVESALGAGSKFSFELRLPVAAAADAAPVGPKVPVGYRGRRRRVLIVDDEPINRDVLRALLAPLGFSLQETDDGQAAIDLISASPPDLVLMDLRLRRVDGLTATRRIRALPGAESVRIVAISASVFPVDRSQAIEAGCDDFEAKPIRTAALLATVGRVLNLDWEFSVASPPAAAPPLPEHLPEAWALPPLALLQELDAHADLGDLSALRTTLAAARASRPEAAAFLDALESLAAHAQLAPLRDWLARALARASLPQP